MSLLVDKEVLDNRPVFPRAEGESVDGGAGDDGDESEDNLEVVFDYAALVGG